MAVLHRHRQPSFWTPQQVPVEAVEVDWSHPLANGLVALYVPGCAQGPVDLTKFGSPISLRSAGGIVSSVRGAGLSGSVSNSGGFTQPTPAVLNLSTAGTLFWGGAVTSGSSTGANPSFIGVSWNLADSSPFFTYSLVGNGANIALFIGGGGNNILTYDTSARSYAASFVFGGALRGFKSGSFIGSTTLAGGAPTYGSDNRLVIGTEISDSTRFSNTITTIGAVYNYALPDNLIAWLDAEPFAMLRPVARRTYGFIVGTTSTPIAGSLVLTGLTPTVTSGTSAAPGAGAITLTGAAPTITTGATALPSAGAITLTGLAPTVAAGTAATPGAGALTLTGKTPAVTAGNTALPGVGAISLSGFTPTISTGTALSPGFGAITLSGFAPTIQSGTSTNPFPGVGTLTLSGFAPFVVLGTPNNPGRTIIGRRQNRLAIKGMH